MTSASEAFAALSERAVALCAQRDHLEVLAQGEVDRFEREDHEHRIAVAAGDYTHPVPQAFNREFSVAYESALHACSSLGEDRKAIIREHSDELNADLDRQEKAVLDGLTEAVEPFLAASKRMADIVDARRVIDGALKPGGRAVAANYSTSPVDVLSAVLSGLDRLPQGSDHRVHVLDV